MARLARALATTTLVGFSTLVDPDDEQVSFLSKTSARSTKGARAARRTGFADGDDVGRTSSRLVFGERCKTVFGNLRALVLLSFFFRVMKESG